MKNGVADVTEAVLGASRALVGIAARSLVSMSEDVTLAQYRVLVLLHGRAPQAMGELAATLGVNPSTVTRLCDLLVDKRLIRRKPAPENRRSVYADLTRTGEDLVDQVMRRRRLLINDVVSRLPPEAQRRLARSMREFSAAAGELSDGAWTLGWSLDSEHESSSGEERAEP